MSSLRRIHAPTLYRAYTTGDPGPSTTRFRKSYRNQLRSETLSSGQNVPLNDLLQSKRQQLDRAPRLGISGASKLPTHKLRPDSDFSKSLPKDEDDPYVLSASLKRYIDKNITSTAVPNPKNVGQAIAMIKTAPKASANVVVWNQLLGMLGKIGSMERMWSTYNDMKKFGIVPSFYTYTTLLNAYAAVPHSGATYPQLDKQAEPKVLSRVSIIWSQAQQAVQDDGLEEVGAQRQEQSRIGPLNAYAKVLSRYGLWQQLLDLVEAKSEKWDIVGYTTVLMGLKHAAKTAKIEGMRKESRKVDIPLGPAARKLWDEAMHDLPQGKGSIDNTLAVLAISSMLMGRPEDQRYAQALIPRIWNLPPPMSRLPPLDGAAPTLTIDLKTATHLIMSLNTARLTTPAAHYTRALLSLPRIRRNVDHFFIYAAATAYANASDPSGITTLLDDYSAPYEGWKIGLVYDALTSARWANDWPSMVAFVRRLTLMPTGVEHGKMTAFHPVSRDSKRDVTRRMWLPDITHTLDAKCMGIILKAALSGSNLRRVQDALRIIDWAGARQVMGGRVSAEEIDRVPSALRYTRNANADMGRQDPGRLKGWTYELAKEVVRAVDVVGQGKDREWDELLKAANTCIEKTSVGNQPKPALGIDKLWRR